MAYVYISGVHGNIAEDELLKEFTNKAEIKLEIPKNTIFKLKLIPNLMTFSIDVAFTFEGKDYNFSTHIDVLDAMEIVKEGKGLNKDLDLVKNGFFYLNGKFLLKDNHKKEYKKLK